MNRHAPSATPRSITSVIEKMIHQAIIFMPQLSRFHATILEDKFIPIVYLFHGRYLTIILVGAFGNLLKAHNRYFPEYCIERLPTSNACRPNEVATFYGLLHVFLD